MRCASWRISSRDRISSSSGWPRMMICSSLRWLVSRLVSRRSCSSTVLSRFCASSMISTVFSPRAWASSRNRLMRSMQVLTLCSLGGIAILSSSQMVSSSSIAETLGFSTSAMLACSGICSSRQRHTVVLPVPTSPLSRMQPPSLLSPNIRCASASRCCAVMYR